MSSIRVTRRTVLAGAVAATALGWRSATHAGASKDAARRSLVNAADYLWRQQADDGGWHSPQYGVLRSGQALTPFVLDALLSVPAATLPRPTGGVDRALSFIVRSMDAQGRLGHADPDIVEYPVYSSAYALKCLSRPVEELGPLDQFAQAVHARQAPNGERILGNSSNVHEPLAKFLSEAQLQNDNGFKPTDPAYGGWGFDAPLAPGRPGHMDLAHTRRAMEALRDAERWNKGKTPIYDHGPVQERLQCFLRVVQKHPRAAARPQLTVDGPTSTAPPPLLFDGGFYFSPVVEAANKGRVDETPAPHWRSYATATCDGILALLAAGVPSHDERVTAAVAWLQRHTNLDYPQGVPSDYPEPWGAAIRFYHYAVRAEAYRALGWSMHERERLAAVVRERQEADGSFVNRESPLMKEDDPVMCTALATVALANSVA
jgi:hypothetical protein